jgi:molybdopterin synthase catalytic subunit
MFNITDSEILIHNLKDSTTDMVGGIVTFEGRVRIDNNKRKVKSLEYEAFPEMAEIEGNKILEEAKNKFKIIHATCTHRTGTLYVRDLAVWIVVYAKHRADAYLANEYIIDQVKTRVPIWKKEYYLDGDSDWVKCLACSAKGIAHHDHFHHT